MFFNKEEKAAIVQAIADAEMETSGEVRIHVDSKCKEDVLDRAAFIFKKLEMHKTELRNGVLIYLAVEDRKFAIVGDVGINIKLPADFWDSVKEKMKSQFVKQMFVAGLTEGILEIGKQLKIYFPYMENDKNELSNEMSFGS